MQWISAKLVVLKGKEAEFEAVVKDLMAQVSEHEPDVPCYQFVRSSEEVGVYRVIEAYPSSEMFATHMASPHLKAAMGQMGPLLAARPEIERFDALTDA